MKKNILVLIAATLSIAGMNYAVANQGVAPTLVEVIKQECGEPSLLTSSKAKIEYDMCVMVETEKYKATKN